MGIEAQEAAVAKLEADGFEVDERACGCVFLSKRIPRPWGADVFLPIVLPSGLVEGKPVDKYLKRIGASK